MLGRTGEQKKNIQQERSPQTKSNRSQLLRLGLRWTYTHTQLPAAEPLMGTERARLEWKFAGWTGQTESHPSSLHAVTRKSPHGHGRKKRSKTWTISCGLAQVCAACRHLSCLKGNSKCGRHICVIYFHSYNLNIHSVTWIPKRHLGLTNTPWTRQNQMTLNEFQLDSVHLPRDRKAASRRVRSWSGVWISLRRDEQRDVGAGRG